MKMMKLKFLLFVGCLMLSAGMAQAQFNAVLYYICDPVPLTLQCAGGGPIPDGTTVEIYWDQNNNGPDPTDDQPVVGPEFGQCNFNSFPMNGLDLFGCEGGFGTDPAFTISTNTPAPSRYWLRICVPGQTRYWRSNSFTILDGLNDYDLTPIFVCVDSGCGGCLTPPIVTGFTASDNSCEEVTLNWSAYPVEANVNTLRIKRDGTEIARVPRASTSYIDTNSPFGVFNYEILAARDCGPGDTALSAAVGDPGTLIQVPLPPADATVFALPHSSQCDKIIVRWTVPIPATSIDSFYVFQNGVFVHRILSGLQNAVMNDTITTTLYGPQNYTVAGFSAECGVGVQTAPVQGTARVAPPQVTGVTATLDSCNSVRISWTAVAGATSYKVNRNGSQIGTTTAPTVTFFDASGAGGTVFQYTVVAVVSTNPAACQDGVPSLPANGSRILPPNAPTSVVASDTIATHVRVTWTDNSTDEDGFIIRRGGTPIDSVGPGVLTFNDSTAVPGTIYGYTVVAYNECGNSSVSNNENGTRPAPPGQVTGVNATDALSDRVTVTWTNLTGESGYIIHRDAVILTAIDSVNADITTFDDFTATPGVVYNYAVQAYNAAGPGLISASNPGGIVATLNAPTNVVASDTICALVRVTWTDNNTAPAETGHTILRNGSSVGSVGVNVTTFDDNTAVQGVVYLYNVQADGTGGPAVSATPDSGRRALLPDAPVIVLDSVTCTAAYVSFTRSTNSDTTILYFDGVPTTTSTAVTGQATFVLGDNNFHTVYGFGGNECGRGDTSNVISAQRDQVPPEVTTFSGDGNSCDTVILTWVAPAEADSIRIFKNGSLLTTQLATLGAYDDQVGNGPLSIQYWVSAVNECGASDTSGLITVQVAQSPTTPTNVAASDTSCQFVWVAWSASVGEVDGYDIYRDGLFVGSTGVDTLIFGDQPLDAIEHSYTVIATSLNCADSDISAANLGRQLEAVGVPTNLDQPANRCDSLVICWVGASGDIDGYIIYQDGDSVGSVPAGTLCFGYVPAPGSYSMTVAAYSSACGIGAESDATNGGMFAELVSPPDFTASTNGCSSVILTWGPQPQFTSQTDYRITRDGTEVFFGSSLNDLRTFEDVDAVLGDNHYSIVALSTLSSCDSSTASLATGTILPEPVAPTTVSATDTSCLDVRVTWSAGSGTFSYYVVNRDGNFLATVIAPTQEYVDNTIAPGDTAEYSVLAVDSICGASGVGGTDSGTRLLGPDAPTGVLASDDDCDVVNVGWNIASGDVTEYRVYRDGVLAGSVLPPTLVFADTPASGTYAYTVTAFSTNCGETAPSVADSGTRLPQMPAVVALQASVDSCGGILVTWVQVAGAVTYQIFRDGDANFLAQVNAPTGEYFDGTVAEGVEHSYTVSAINTCNNGALSNSVTGSRAQTPGQVTGLTASTTLINMVCLEWDDISGELGYNIYRDAVLIFNASADDTAYCDNSATPGTPYSYTVAATNVCGEGLQSVAALGVSVFNLVAVTNLAATTTDCQQICLSWSDINFETGYEILRTGVVIDTADENATSYCDLTPLPGECYNYTVRGINVGGSGPSAPVVEGCRRDVPTQVQGLTATTTNCTVVILNWTDVADEDGYDVYRDGGLLVQNLPANTITYSDNTATPGTPYQYTVVARNACGLAPVSAGAQGVVAITPPIVTGLVATVDVCNQIGLGWTDQLSELGYRIYRDGNFTTPIASVGANVVAYVDNSIIGSHTYNVRAFNDCGNGELSATATGIGLTTPGIATGVTAVENCGDVTVSWTAPATSPITEYRILRNGTQIGAVPSNLTTYVDQNLAAGTYSYRIITANQCGAGTQSALSNSVIVIPALLQVQNFSAVASECFCVDIAWSNVANEDGYYIYCNNVIADTVGPNSTSTQFCPADTQTCVIQVAAFNSCEIGPLSAGATVTPNTYPVAVTGFTASENMCDRVRLTWNVYSQPGVTHLKIRRNGVSIGNTLSGNTSFEHLGLWPTSAYSITALRVCAVGDTIESALAVDNGRTAPTPVGASQMAASDDGCGIVTVTFTFANVDGQDSVRIRRNGTILAVLAGGLANVQRSFVDSNPLVQPANYEVCPVSNSCGQGPCASDLGQAAPTAGIVTNLTATNDRCTSILLEWTGTPFALNYQIRRNGTLIETVPQGTFTYSNTVPVGSTFNYTVAATNACGSGPQTPAVQGSTIPLPPAPTGVSASDGLCNQVIVSWNEVAVATEYHVLRNNVPLATVPGGVEFYNDTDVIPGVVYNYQVRGVNQCGDGALSAATQGSSSQPVGTVTNLVASTNLNDRVRLTWNNVPQETGYEILRGFPAEVIATVIANVTSYDDFSAAPGEEYEYRVRAINGCGIGELSTVSFGYRVPVDPIPFTAITLTDELFGCMSAEVFDGDDDGDPDVIAAGMFADQIVAYENNGSWGYIPHVIVDNWDGARSVAVGDIDGDGDDDAAAVAQFADQLIWIQGNGTLNPVVRTIASNYDGARDVIITDLDGDNDMDLVTCACDANDISWWRNNGSEVFTRFVIDNNFIGARSIEVADIGGDGDLDILAAAYEGGMLAWYSNNGSETFTRNVLMEDAFGASYINAARLNNDNVLDIYFCIAQEPLIAWWDGATMEQHYVTSLVPFPREMDAIDMDDDNRADLLLAGNENQEISWWRNTDNRFYRNVITSTLTQASVVHGGDFDGDGDTDVLGAGEGTIKIWLSSLSDDLNSTEVELPRDEDEGDQPTYSQSIVPLNYELSSNYPNPFNPMTQIRFGLPEAQSVKLVVYDVTGREVARLAEGSFGAGYHTVTFDASHLASGVYLYRIEAGSFVQSRKMVLMK